MDIDDPIPHLDTVDDPFDSPAGLRQRWRALMGPLGFTESLLWVKPVHPDHTLSRFTLQIEQGMPPAPTLADLLMVRLAELLDHGDDVIAGFALLLSRPGLDGISPWDEGWTRLFADSARVFDVPIEPIFRANTLDVREVTIAGGGRSVA